MRLTTFCAGLLLGVSIIPRLAMAAEPPHNVVLFVADGLRGSMVDDSTAPNMAQLARQGVHLRNGHSLFPTFTTANASALATGHYLGDTGDFSNTIYAGFGVPSAANSVTPFIENDLILGDLDQHYGDYLDEPTILNLARDRGYGTAAIGKLGPSLIFDHTDRNGTPTIIVDDATGSEKGMPLAPDVAQRLTALGLPVATPARGENGKAGDAKTPGTHVANVTQQDYFAAVATRAVLPMLAERGQPFLMVYWSRDPDGTQHNAGDSLNSLVPGINGPTSLAGIRNADDNLGRSTRRSGRARPRRHDRHRRDRRSRLFDDLQAERHQLGGEGQLRRRPGGIPAPGLRRHRPRPRIGNAALRPRQPGGRDQGRLAWELDNLRIGDDPAKPS